MGRILFAIAVAAVTVGNAVADQPGSVERSGQHSTVKLESVVAGHLTDLNGRYKLRVTEVKYDPGGYIGGHHHAGPGIRCVTGGELTYVQPDKTTVYRTGDCFFESGDISHTAHNYADKPVLLLNFEILPLTWSGGSATPEPK